jgi:hypothetical protein
MVRFRRIRKTDAAAGPGVRYFRAEVILAGSIFVILGGAVTVAVCLWARGPGRRTARLGPDGRSVRTVPPYQLVVGLLFVLYGVVRLVTL